MKYKAVGNPDIQISIFQHYVPHFSLLIGHCIAAAVAAAASVVISNSKAVSKEI